MFIALFPRRYADEGHAYKVESQGYVQDRRNLIAEINHVKDLWEDARGPFQAAKHTFASARSEFDNAKAHHEQKQAEFRAIKANLDEWRAYIQGLRAEHDRLRNVLNQAKATFDTARAEFRIRVDAVRAEREQRINDKRELASRAGVPHEYLEDVHVTVQSDGTVSILFGGSGSADGPGHGHYVMDASGDVVYRREPYDDHGAQNFADYEERPVVTFKPSPVHDGKQGYPHTDINSKRNGKKTRDKSGHHQRQSPGYGPDAVDIPINPPKDH